MVGHVWKYIFFKFLKKAVNLRSNRYFDLLLWHHLSESCLETEHNLPFSRQALSRTWKQEKTSSWACLSVLIQINSFTPTSHVPRTRKTFASSSAPWSTTSCRATWRTTTWCKGNFGEGTKSSPCGRRESAAPPYDPKRENSEASERPINTPLPLMHFFVLLEHQKKKNASSLSSQTNQRSTLWTDGSRKCTQGGREVVYFGLRSLWGSFLQGNGGSESRATAVQHINPVSLSGAGGGLTSIHLVLIFFKLYFAFYCKKKSTH